MTVYIKCICPGPWTKGPEHAGCVEALPVNHICITTATLHLLAASFPGQPGQAGTRKVKPV